MPDKKDELMTAICRETDRLKTIKGHIEYYYNEGMVKIEKIEKMLEELQGLK